MRPRTRLTILAAVAGTSVLGTCSPALANDFQLTVSTPAMTNVGEPTVVHVDGIDPPPSVYPFTTWLDIAVIPVSVTPTCPQDVEEATQLAPAVGGGNITMFAPEPVDATGHFSVIAGFTPIGAATVIICAYSKDDAANTLAIAAARVEIVRGAPVPGGTPTSARAPRNVARPRLSRAGAIINCTRGRWSGAVSRYAYRWLIDGRGQPGSSGNQMLVLPGLHGHVVKCAVTAVGAAGKLATATSTGLRIR